MSAAWDAIDMEKEKVAYPVYRIALPKGADVKQKRNFEQQVAAIKGAINGLMNELIELHLREHVLGDTEKIKEKELNEFLALVKRYL